MKVSDALKLIKDALLTVDVPVYHYFAEKQTDKYIVWAEDSPNGSVWGDDVCECQILEGTIDYFTREEFDPIVDEIQNALNTGEITWYYNSIQYERDTGYIHHEWVWEVAT